MIRIGANPIGWSNDDMPEIGGEIPLERCLAEAKAAGFEGMELGHKFPRSAAGLGPVLDAHGLSLVGGWFSTGLLVRDAAAEMEAARAHGELLAAMGCGIFIAAETSNAIHSDRSRPLSARPVLDKGAWKGFGERCTEFAARLADLWGLRLVYHHHMGTVVQTESEIDRFMEVTGEPVQLLLDTGHATWGGADPARLARHWRPRIGHIHCKDVREAVMWHANRHDLSFLDSVLEGIYTVPGDGIVDYVRVLGEMRGYSGWIVVEAEQDPAKAPPATYAAMGRANLSRFLAGAGLVP